MQRGAQMFNKTIRMLELISMKTGLDVSECLKEVDEAIADHKELVIIADKWTDAAIQEELYLGRCLKACLEQNGDLFDLHYMDIEDIIEWGKEQGVE